MPLKFTNRWIRFVKGHNFYTQVFAYFSANEGLLETFLFFKKNWNLLARIFICTISIRWVGLMHGFSLFSHGIQVGFVCIIAAVICPITIRTWLVIRHFWSTDIVLVVPIANLFVFNSLTQVLNLRGHNGVSRRLNDNTILRRVVGAIMLVNNCGYRWGWCGTWCCDANRSCRRRKL